MLKKVFKQCYDVGRPDKSEYKVFPQNCPIKREYCFGGYTWIGEESPECTVEDICKFCDVRTFEDFYNRVDCSHDDMGCIVYCPGTNWQCPVMDQCLHTKISKDEHNYITPKYVGKTGCNAFINMGDFK